jgi:RNA polymerase sigma factor (sigma-70 family)
MSALHEANATDIGELYGALSKRLEQIVRSDVRAPGPVIEDACQFAWCRLIHHCSRVRRETVFPWLVKTAVHEAFKLIRRDGRELSLDAALESAGEPVLRLDAPRTEELVEQHQRLAEIGYLPERQQRLVWLHGMGFTYGEMSSYTGCTPRTVERQLLRAKQRLRAGE